MNNDIVCTTCGTQYAQHEIAGAACAICNDDRQYVPEHGQIWTSLQALQSTHSLITKQLHQQLYEIKMVPSFAIGQRALLVVTPEGNVLWDCVTLLTEPVIAWIKSLGGLKAIAFSHPHYYTTMNEWAGVFDCPIYIHESDAPWVFNRGPQLQFWTGADMALWSGMRIINVGGHFPGSCILQVPFLSAGGAVLCGDTFYIAPGKKHIAVMYSYPNRIPLPLQEVQRIKKRMHPISFDTMYGFYDYQNLEGNAKTIMENSFNRYV
jgi:hypothetical protein